jgi:hypothetical protein
VFKNSFVDWSNDETIFALLAGEILFFAKNDPGILLSINLGSLEFT